VVEEGSGFRISGDVIGHHLALGPDSCVPGRLDGLICAWIGIEHLEGRTTGRGDATAAIWVP